MVKLRRFSSESDLKKFHQREFIQRRRQNTFTDLFFDSVGIADISYYSTDLSLISLCHRAAVVKFPSSTFFFIPMFVFFVGYDDHSGNCWIQELLLFSNVFAGYKGNSSFHWQAFLFFLGGGWGGTWRWGIIPWPFDILNFPDFRRS